MKKVQIKFQNSISDEDMRKQGIYKITNTVNGCFYIGSVRRTGTFRNRFVCHQRQFERWLIRRKNACIKLFQAFAKFSIENFKVEILEIMVGDRNILEREEYYITTLHPEYNICQTPTKSGLPNKGRKLTKEWKEHIAEKSKLYKHDAETLKKVTNNNKQNACRITLQNENETLHFNSWVEVGKYFGLTNSRNIQIVYKNNKKYKGYTIIKESSQRKKIKVFFDDDIKIFNSFNECDRALDMWRGYTSTMYTRNMSLLKDKYRYKVI